MSRYKVSAIKTKYAFISSTVSSLVALLSIYVATKKKKKKKFQAQFSIQSVQLQFFFNLQ